MSEPRFHVPGAAPGARVTLPEHSAHHARNVLRLGAGAAIRVFHDGVEWRAVLEQVSRQRVVARVEGPIEPLPEAPLGVALAVSPLRGDRMDLVVQKATELGVAELWPVVCERTDAAARPALRGTRQERWEKVASGAAEQCGRARVPELAPTRSLAEWIAAPPAGRRLFLLERSGAPGLASLEAPGDRLCLLVGPPGGFAPHEIQAVREAGFDAVSLGPRVLRAETAAIAAVAAVQTLWGDLG